MENNLELLKYAAELYPCPDYYGERVVVSISESYDRNSYELCFNCINPPGLHFYAVIQHIRIWINRVCKFINFSHYLININWK